MIVGIVRQLTKLYAATIGPHMPAQGKAVLRKIYGATVGRRMENASVDDTHRFYSQIGIIEKGSLVFDVGANRGGMAAVFLALGARVICIDPDPRCVEMLKKRFSGRQDVKIVAAGVGSSEGELELSLGETDGNSTFSGDFRKLEESEYRGRYTGSVKARMTTLGALMNEHGAPSYIKMDVEGFEFEALSGMPQKVRFLSFEFHREHLDRAKKCVDVLEKLGMSSFNWTHHDPTKKPFCSEKWVGSKELFSLIEAENPHIADDMGDVNFYRVGDIFARSE